jgi:hypothetical protein
VRVYGPRDAGEVGWGEVKARVAGGEGCPGLDGVEGCPGHGDRLAVPVQGGEGGWGGEREGGGLPKGVREFLKKLIPLSFGKEMVVGRRLDVYWEGVHRF